MTVKEKLAYRYSYTIGLAVALHLALRGRLQPGWRKQLRFNAFCHAVGVEPHRLP